MPPRIHRRAALFAKEENAAVAIVFALAAGALMVVAGVAVDYTSIMTRRTQTQAAADRAVLSAVCTAYDRRMAGDAQWSEIGRAAGLSALTASPIGNTALQTTDLKVEDTGGGVSGTLTYSAEHKLLFFNSIKDSVVETGVATAQIATSSFRDIHFLVDVSMSMGIGATTGDQYKMLAATGCALACHYNTSVGSDNYAQQRASGAQFRIDVVRNAIVSFLTDAQKQQTGAGELRVSIDLISNGATQLLPPTTDIAAAIAAAAKIDITSEPHFGGTNFTESFKQVLSRTSPGGDGLLNTSRKSYVVILSDGIENSTSMQPDIPGWYREVFDPAYVLKAPSYVSSPSETVQTITGAASKPLKDAKHTVITGLIEYLIPPDWGGFGWARLNYIQNTLKPLSTVAFKDCASDPSFALTASTSADIEAMLAKIGTLITTVPRLRLTQ